MSKPRSSTPRYRTTNWPSYNAALKSRGSLTIWLDKRMQWFAAASGKRGRSPKFSDAAIQFCLTIKNLFSLALRQAVGFVESLLKLSGLHLLVDSTGIKFLGEGEWKCKKHGAERRRQWRKLHIGIDAQTLQIRTICVTSNEVTHATVVAGLLEQVPRNEAVLSLTGDGAYDTQSVYEATIQRGAIPSFPRKRTHEYAKAMPLCTAMRLSPHAGVWAEGYGKCGAVTTDAAWWRPR